MKAPKFVEVPKKRHGFIWISWEFHYKMFLKNPKNKSNVKSKEDEKSKFGNNLTQNFQLNCICLDRILWWLYFWNTSKNFILFSIC